MWELLEGGWLFWLSVTDIRYRRVSLGWLAAGIPLGLTFFVRRMLEGDFGAVSLLLGLLPGALMLLLSATKNAGCGDGISLLVLSLAETAKRLLPMFFLSLLFMSLAAIGLLVFRRAGRKTHLPYLPFLFMGWGAVRFIL